MFLRIFRENRSDDVASAQEQTGKGASLWVARATPSRRRSPAGRCFRDRKSRKKTGEVEAKVLCGWPERRLSACLLCSDITRRPRGIGCPAGPFFYGRSNLPLTCLGFRLRRDRFEEFQNPLRDVFPAGFADQPMTMAGEFFACAERTIAPRDAARRS